MNAMLNQFEFGAWVRQLRKARRLSRQAVSERASNAGHVISQQYVHFIETGKATNIGSDKVLALAWGLGIPVAILEQALFRRSVPVIPLAGRAAAGFGIPSDDAEYREQFPYEPYAEALQAQQLFYVEVIGDSMAPKIEHGDWALVQPAIQEPWASGRIYLVQERKTKKTTCKYVVEDNANLGQYWLVGEQESLFPKTLLDRTLYQILGEIIEVRKTQTLSRPIL